MKNVHLLPTDKPSRLGYLTKKGKEVFKDLRLFDKPMPNILDSENQHIYITSDEEIKEGDYVVQTNFEKTNTQVIKCETEFQTKIANSKDGSFSKNKIILTTDQDLINEGVQPIDDEFLEWFVKNPTCESVEVYKNPFYEESNYEHYKIIIPQEEPKQEWKPKEGEEVWIKVFSNWSSGKYIGYDVDKKVHLVREPEEGGGYLFSSPYILPYSALPNEPKKETIEEAADNWVRQPVIGTKRESFIKGAEWQAERMYSLADLEVAFFEGRKKNSTFVELFEQFKNK
jgi:hypothetical protein